MRPAFAPSLPVAGVAVAAALRAGRVDRDGGARNAGRLELRDVDRAQVQPVAAAAAGADEIPGELRGDLAADLVAAGADGGAEPGAQRSPARRRGARRAATADAATFCAEPRQPACAAPTARGAARRIGTQSAVWIARATPGRSVASASHSPTFAAPPGGRIAHRRGRRAVHLLRPVDRQVGAPERDGEPPREKRCRRRLAVRRVSASRERDDRVLRSVAEGRMTRMPPSVSSSHDMEGIVGVPAQSPSLLRFSGVGRRNTQ